MPTIQINCKVLNRVRKTLDLPSVELKPQREQSWRTNMAGEVRNEEEKKDSDSSDYSPSYVPLRSHAMQGKDSEQVRQAEFFTGKVDPNDPMGIESCKAKLISGDPLAF